jgi:glutaredoxin 3
MFCGREKAWLSEHSIEFEEQDVAADEEALEELERRNVFSTPATLVDDELVVGFDRERLSRLLEIES